MTNIYALVDPRNYAIRYIGKAGNIKKRLTDHLAESRTKAKAHRLNWLRQLSKLGLKPDVLIIEECDETAWQERERYWIAEYRRRGADLTNGTDGGDGGALVGEALEKMRASVTAFMRRPDVRARNSAQASARTGRRNTPATLGKMRQSALRRLATPQGKMQWAQALLARWEE